MTKTEARVKALDHGVCAGGGSVMKTETVEQIPVYPEDEHKYSGLLEE